MNLTSPNVIDSNKKYAYYRIHRTGILNGMIAEFANKEAYDEVLTPLADRFQRRRLEFAFRCLGEFRSYEP